MPALTDQGAQAYTLTALALSYLFSGQPGRAVPLLKRHNEMRQQQGDKLNQQIGLSNLGRTLRETGALRETACALRQALVLARELKDTCAEGMSLVELGRALSTMGDQLSHVELKRSQQIFAKKQLTQSEGVSSAYLAERWLWLGDFPKARLAPTGLGSWRVFKGTSGISSMLRSFKVERRWAWATSKQPTNACTTPLRERGQSM